VVCIDEANPYFAMIRESWGQRLRDAFEGIDNPVWGPTGAGYPLSVRSERYDVLRKIQHPTEKLV
jgi:putative proteasome-type protease